MNERNELAKLLFAHHVTDRAAETVPSIAALCESAAAEILAAGYRRPRTITTVEELDALGTNSAVLSNGGVYVNDGDLDGEPWASLVEHSLAGPIWVDSGALTLPATLLHAGATK